MQPPCGMGRKPLTADGFSTRLNHSFVLLHPNDPRQLSPSSIYCCSDGRGSNLSHLSRCPNTCIPRRSCPVITFDETGLRREGQVGVRSPGHIQKLNG